MYIGKARAKGNDGKGEKQVARAQTKHLVQLLCHLGALLDVCGRD